MDDSSRVSAFKTPRGVSEGDDERPFDPPAREVLRDYNDAALARVRSAGSVSISQVSVSQTESSAAATDSGAAQELAEMRKKLGMFMLGGDMSGGQAGTHAALTLSNAITNLSVGCWSAVAELSPLPSVNIIKWRQQVRWYTAPLEQIIVKEEGFKTLKDGSQVEVMQDVLRQDVRTHLPRLREVDDEQQALYARFFDVEWQYVKPTPPAAGEAPAQKWWRKVPAIKAASGTLSERAAREVACMVTWCSAKVAVCRRVNDECIQGMVTPADFLEALPKHAKTLQIGDAMRRALEKSSGSAAKGSLHELAYVEGVFGVLTKDGVDRTDKLKLMEVLSHLEKAALIWDRKAEKDSKLKKDSEKAGNARRVISSVRSAMPGLGQTPLETAKLANNR